MIRRIQQIVISIYADKLKSEMEEFEKLMNSRYVNNWNCKSRFSIKALKFSV